MDRSSKGTAFIQWAEEVPADWSSVRLRNLLTSVLAGSWGYDPGSSDIDLLCARIADFDWNRLEIRDENIHTRRSYTHDQAKRFVLESGDLLVEKSGGGEKHPVGRCVQYQGEGGPAFANFAMRLRVNESVSSGFLCYSLAASYYRGHSWKILNQTTGIQNLDVSAFRSSPIPLPPRAEQRAIVDFLDAKTAEIDGLVGKLERQVELLERYRRELIAHTVTRGLDPDVPMKDSSIEWIGDIPSHWTEASLKSMLRRVSVKNKPKRRVLSVERVNGVVDRETEGSPDNHNRLPDNLSAYLAVDRGQFAMNKMKAWRGSYGISRLDGIVSPAYYVFDLNHPNPEFFNWAIRSDAYIPFFGRDSYGIRTDQWDFKMSALRSIPFFSPPMSEQAAIVAYLEKETQVIDSTIEGIRKQIELLGKYRKQVINDAVTGKVRVGEVA